MVTQYDFKCNDINIENTAFDKDSEMIKRISDIYGELTKA